MREHLIGGMLGALSNLFTISWYSRKVCSCKYTRMDVNISGNPLLVFQLKKCVWDERTSLDFISNRCSAETRWCHGNVCACGRCTAAAWLEKRFPPSCIFQIISNQGSVSHVSCCFCCHQRQKTFQILFFAHRNSPNTQLHFLCYVPPFCLPLFLFLDTFFPFLMAKTEQRNRENHRIFYLI